MLLSADDIGKIIAGCKKNDRKAQERLYYAFHKSMGVICMRYTNNIQDAGTILNNGFLNVFKKIEQYDASKSAFATWLRTIMIHAAIDFTRRKSIFYLTALEDIPHAASVENEVILKIDADALLQHVQNMSPATRLVFNLYTIDGYNHREISQELGISEATSRWHLNEARKFMKRSILIHQI